MNTNTKCKQWRMPFLLILFTLFFCWLFCGRYGVFGSKVDWISQHSVFPDYFRQQFYDTGDFFPEFAAGIEEDRTFITLPTMDCTVLFFCCPICFLL